MCLDRALTAHPNVRTQGHVDASAPVLPVPLDEGEIAFLEPPLPQERVQRTQRTCPARNEETAARVPVQAMYEFQGVLGAQRPQHFDDSETHPATSVDRNPGGLVNDEESVLLDEDRSAQALEERPGNTGGGTLRVDSHGGHPNLVMHS